MIADVLIDNADLVATCAGPGPRRGSSQREITAIANASVAGFEGRIVFVGSAHDAAATVTLAPSAQVIDAQGCTVVPGFVDPHTHLVFAGDRRDELRRRLAGASYAEIAESGGGIVKTVDSTRVASEHDLVTGARRRLAEMLSFGTTTAEAKSGYGLGLAAERKMLCAIKTVAAGQPIELTATFMGAHEVPVEFRHDRAAYVREIIDVMIPAVASEQLAEWCDVFCERGVFTPDESRDILLAGQRNGMKSRVHADELALSGGSRVAADVGARSADHLIFVDDVHAELLADRGVVATLLPSAAFFLKLGRYAPARMLIEHNVAVALATDLNPGGGFTTSMPFVMSLACFAMNLTLEEALNGATINAAAAIDRQDTIGSLEVGKQLDAVVVNGMLTDLIRVGGPVIGHVLKRGRVVHMLNVGPGPVFQH